MNELTSAQVDTLRDTLLNEQRDLERRLQENEHFGLTDTQRDATGELSPIDNHPADLATETYERGKDIALNEHAERQLSQVELALLHMDQGTYGACAVCNKPISFERLQAIPTTEYCLEHVPDYEAHYSRPIEEAFLYPGFGRTDTDDVDSTAFDGEDAWQIVSSWGTSNSPALSESGEKGGYNEMYMEEDENDGYVEPIESFLATDLYGNRVSVVRNEEYRRYMQKGEGDPLLEPDRESEELHRGLH